LLGCGLPLDLRAGSPDADDVSAGQDGRRNGRSGLNLSPTLRAVNGHWEIRSGGLVFSGVAATSFPGWWPCVLPAGGG
jgi:hypothetical protein